MARQRIKAERLKGRKPEHPAAMTGRDWKTQLRRLGYIEPDTGGKPDPNDDLNVFKSIFKED